MAKPTTEIKVERKAYGTLFVWCDDKYIEDLLKIEGINLHTRLNGDLHVIDVSPRYDIDAVITEIENLGAPIPEAFLGDK